MTLASRISDELLPRVRRPAQYIGSEVNQLVGPGDWDAAEIRVVIGFPDAYTIGMSHLGCQILYWLCNHTEGVCAERTYAPWIDAEQVMRARGIPLFTWDSRRPVSEADIFAISLQYELTFTTVLNMLDLAGIPLHARDRTDEHPLVIVGGPQADNPEPMADFVDLVVIGDGERSLASILEAYREYQRAGIGRRAMIPLLAKRFPWIYAPNLYDVRYHDDGTIRALEPQLDGLPLRIERCKTTDFDAAPFPTRPLVPWVEVVHDRIGIEIMRGCPQVCRFCHAGYTKRPLNLRSVERILEIAEQAYRSTGQQEIGLLSLSTADYPYLRELADRINERFAPRMVNLSFPSLRVDKMLANIPWMANSVRKGGITMAVEAARDSLRRAIRKKVTDGDLLDSVREVYKAGWRRIKLYFMAGFPSECEDDIRGIYEVARAVSLERTKLGLPAGQVTASVGWLVPKPFTPLQWMGQPRVEYFRRVRETLRAVARTAGRGVKVICEGQGGYGAAAEWANENDLAKRAMEGGTAVSAVSSDEHHSRNPLNPEPQSPNPRRGPRPRVTIRMHDADRSVLEAVFARGDRRLGPVIYEAWRRGARFDGWDECYDDAIWQAAFASAGVDPDWYAHRERNFSEVLPWDHISLHMRRGYLEKSYDDLLDSVGYENRSPAIRAGTNLTDEGDTGRSPEGCRLPVLR